MLGEEFEGFRVAGHRSYAEVFDVHVLGFGDDCFHEGFADAFSSVGLADDSGFDFARATYASGPVPMRPVRAMTLSSWVVRAQ